MTARVVFIIAAVSLAGGGSVFADKGSKEIKQQKQELEQIQREMEDGQRRLDSLEAEKKRVSGSISKYDERMASDRQVLRRLGRELDQLKRNISVGDSLLQTSRELFDRRRRRYLGNIRQFYLLSHQTGATGENLPNDELESQRRIVYLTALAGFESGTVSDASALVDSSAAQLADLSDRRKTVSGLKKERETSYSLGKSQRERQEKNLVQIQRKSTVEADRVINLQQAAQEMQEIIARLERAREQRAQVPGRPSGSAFAASRGQLLAPYQGRIVETYGEHVDPVSRLKSFSPGISIKGKARAAVYAVASGTVAYAGNLRGYGNFIIISHDERYYSTYAGLSEVLVAENQFVSSRAKLGTADQDGLVRFELREGRESLDPVKWLDLDSF